MKRILPYSARPGGFQDRHLEKFRLCVLIRAEIPRVPVAIPRPLAKTSPAGPAAGGARRRHQERVDPSSSVSDLKFNASSRAAQNLRRESKKCKNSHWQPLQEFLVVGSWWFVRMQRICDEYNSSRVPAIYRVSGETKRLLATRRDRCSHVDRSHGARDSIRQRPARVCCSSDGNILQYRTDPLHVRAVFSGSRLTGRVTA